MPKVTRRKRTAAPGAGRYARDEEKDFEKDEEPFEEPPRRSRRGRGDDEEDAPRRSRGRRSSRDEEEEEDAPRGRSRRSRDDDEEDEPRGRSRRGSRDDDEDEEEDDDIVGSGWQGWEDQGGNKPRGSGNFPDKVSLNANDAYALVAFLDSEPFATYKRHWVSGRSYTCFGEECPLCDVGDEPTPRAAFNVVVFHYDEKGEGDPEIFDPPPVMVYDASPTVAKDIRKKDEDPRKGPITAHYWEIECEKSEGKGKGGFTKHKLNLVKERDLLEDWEVEPMTDEEFDEVIEEAWTVKEYPYRGKVSELEEVAEDLVGSSRGRDRDEPSRRRGGRRRR